MTDPKVLQVFGTSDDQLRTYFTKDLDDPESATGEKARKFVDWLRDVIADGRKQMARDYRFFTACDLAWDAPPISPETVPLMAWAQGKITMATAQQMGCTTGTESSSDDPSCATQFNTSTTKDCPTPSAGVKDDGKEKTAALASLPKLVDVSVNLGRSYIARRADAQDAKYIDQEPFFLFKPRDTSLVGALRGEVMGQYAEIMSDGYGYKHLHKQLTRDMLKYGRVFQFPVGAWDRAVSIQLDPNGGKVPVDPDNPNGKMRPKTRNFIEREGVKFIKVHPARVMFDTAHAPATLNTDTGCQWVGFDDVARFGDIEDETNYFNRDKIRISSGAGGFVAGNQGFYDLVYSSDSINLPSPRTNTDATVGGSSSVDPASSNERTANKHCYSSQDREKSVFVTDLRIKVVPRDWGMGDYPQPVWLRLVVASDDTVIYAEWLPSLPAIYWGHNEDDNRIVNLSMMHELMPWQDQLSNIIANLLLVMKRSLFQCFLLNKDLFTGKEGQAAINKFEATLQGTAYWAQHHLLKVSLSKLGNLLSKTPGTAPSMDAVMKLVQADPMDSEYLFNAIRAMREILALVDRLMNMSPQELGQVSQTEITATQSTAIEATTQVKFKAVSQSIDEARAAWRRVIYEAAMAHADDRVPELPVAQRFTAQVIAAAGFKVVEDPYRGTEEEKGRQVGRTVVGTKSKLVHAYLFASRDGSSRSSNLQEATTILNFMGQLLPVIQQSMGQEQLIRLVNEIFRRVLPIDLKVELEPGTGPTVDVFAQMQEQLQQLAGEQADLAGAVEDINKFLQEQANAAQQGGETAA